MTVEAPADSKSIARRYADVSGAALLRAVIEREFVGRIALVSSFGADSAVLLHMVSEIAPALPVLFLDTEKLFGETLRYRDQLVGRLGLTGVRDIHPDQAEIAVGIGSATGAAVAGTAACSPRPRGRRTFTYSAA